MNHPGRSAGRRTRCLGIAALEAIALLPVFLLLLLGIIESTRLLWTRSILAHAARETVRIAMVHGQATNDPYTAAQLRSRFLAATQAIDADALTLTISPDWDSGGSPGSVFRLTATYEFALLWDVLGAPTATLEVYAQSSVSN